MEEESRFAGRQAGRQARLTGAGKEELRRAGKDTSISTKAKTLERKILCHQNTGGNNLAPE